MKGGNVIHKQKRVGKNGTIFYVYKFRTLKVGSPKVIEMGYSALTKLKDDPRVEGTLGRLLRKWKIDEIPQLINVLKGDMLLLGPRPYIIDENLHMTEAHVERFAVRPGMSGYWQALKTNLNDPDEKATLDCKYVREISLTLDLKIWLNTFKVVLLGENFSSTESRNSNLSNKSKEPQKRAS
jgi:lipopolysaccharide/colanic/teichoic acid biosynthesis glycosyltransferase